MMTTAMTMMSDPKRIVTSTYRYKRPPRWKKAVALEVPAVVRAVDPAARRQPMPATPESTATLPAVVSTSIKRAGTSTALPAANDDRQKAIVTIRRKPERILPSDLLPETPKEHQRRGDAADALWREIVRRVAKKT